MLVSMGGMHTSVYILAHIYLSVLEVIVDGCESPTKLTPQPTLSGFPFASIIVSIIGTRQLDDN